MKLAVMLGTLGVLGYGAYYFIKKSAETLQRQHASPGVEGGIVPEFERRQRGFVAMPIRLQRRVS
jgi:hypothetical protein